jgi:hypothetical protein
MFGLFYSQGSAYTVCQARKSFLLEWLIKQVTPLAQTIPCLCYAIASERHRDINSDCNTGHENEFIHQVCPYISPASVGRTTEHEDVGWLGPAWSTRVFLHLRRSTSWPVSVARRHGGDEL